MDFKEILERVKSRVEAKPEECPPCHDTGLVFTKSSKGVNKVYACHCEKGAPNREPKFFPGDKNKEKPYYLDVWGKKPDSPQAKHAAERMPYKD